MEKVGSHEAKTNPSKLLDKVAQDQRITIISLNTAFPSPRWFQPALREKLIQKKSSRKSRSSAEGVSLRGLSLQKMIKEGRRF